MKIRNALSYSNRALAECVVFQNDMFAEARKLCSEAIQEIDENGFIFESDFSELSDKKRLDLIKRLILTCPDAQGFYDKVMRSLKRMEGEID